MSSKSSSSYLSLVADTNIDIMTIVSNTSCKCHRDTLSIPRIGLNTLAGLSRYGVCPGEMRSLWRVILRDINATMALRYTGK